MIDFLFLDRLNFSAFDFPRFYMVFFARNLEKQNKTITCLPFCIMSRSGNILICPIECAFWSLNLHMVVLCDPGDQSHVLLHARQAVPTELQPQVKVLQL